MNQPLVSILIPCYNCEKTLERCFNSVLSQTYKRLEIILIDDGSSDNSAQICKEYEKKFIDTDMIFQYVFQENQGLGGAINTGLKRFSGDYLCWIDSDDYLFSESIRKRVEFLESHREFAVVTSDANYYDENDLEHPIKKASDGKEDLENPNHFIYHILGKSIFCCGCHMVRSKAFLDVVPNRSIYPARRGQNWQMLLPVYYKYKRAFLAEPLYGYIQYKSGMSFGDVTKEQYLERYKEHLEIIKHTLESIHMPSKERKSYLNMYYGIYQRQRFYLGISFHDYKMILNGMLKMICYHELKLQDLKWCIQLIQKNLFQIKRLFDYGKG